MSPVDARTYAHHYRMLVENATQLLAAMGMDHANERLLFLAQAVMNHTSYLAGELEAFAAQQEAACER